MRLSVAALGLLCVCAAAAGILAHQVAQVQSELEQTVSLVPQLRADLGGENYEGAQQTFDQMQHRIAAAQTTVTGPLWKAASAFPIAGRNFSAVSEVVVSADDIGSRAVAPLLGQYESLGVKGLTPIDGKIDVEQLQEATPTISTAANTVKLSYERIASIDRSKLMPQIAEPIRSATEQLQEVSDVLDDVSSAARLLPAMLGANDPRDYLLLVQNNAEARATGGIPGALVTLHTDNGLITMGNQSSASALGAFTPPLAVDPEQEALYTARLGAQMQNVNLTPDFPTAAFTAKRMWEQRHNGQSIDGVIALDPIVLSHLLEATGPVVLTDPEVIDLIRETSLPKSLTTENVVSTLLSDVYGQIEDPATQDAYFAAVAGQVFAAFTNGQGDGGQLMKALATSVQEGRLYLWSAQSDEQDIVASTALAGSVAGVDGGGSAIGVYFNDGTGAKMDYYAKRTVQLQQTCRSDGYSNYTVRLNISNTAPLDAASTLPPYVTGDGVFGVDPGRIRTNYVVYGPAQAFVEAATVDGAPVPIGSGRHGQRPVGTVALELGPGQTAEMDILFSRVVQDDISRLDVTPGLEEPEKMVLPTEQSGCG